MAPGPLPGRPGGPAAQTAGPAAQTTQPPPARALQAGASSPLAPAGNVSVFLEGANYGGLRRPRRESTTRRVTRVPQLPTTEGRCKGRAGPSPGGAEGRAGAAGSPVSFRQQVPPGPAARPGPASPRRRGDAGGPAAGPRGREASGSGRGEADLAAAPPARGRRGGAGRAALLTAGGCRLAAGGWLRGAAGDPAPGGAGWSARLPPAMAARGVPCPALPRRARRRLPRSALPPRRRPLPGPSRRVCQHGAAAPALPPAPPRGRPAEVARAAEAAARRGWGRAAAAAGAARCFPGEVGDSPVPLAPPSRGGGGPGPAPAAPRLGRPRGRPLGRAPFLAESFRRAGGCRPRREPRAVPPGSAGLARRLGWSRGCLGAAAVPGEARPRLDREPEEEFGSCFRYSAYPAVPTFGWGGWFWWVGVFSFFFFFL